MFLLKFYLFIFISGEKILAPVQGQGHAQVEEKENVHVTRKGGSAVGLSPLPHDPGHALNRGLAVGKDEDVLGLAHLAGYLRSTERDGHHIDVGGRHLQEDVRHQGEEHHQGEGTYGKAICIRC